MHLDLPTSLPAQRRKLLVDTAERLNDIYGSKLLGLVLSGSAGRGLDTDRSDLDLLVVLDEEATHHQSESWLHTPELEELPITLAGLETAVPFDSSEYVYRWSFGWAPVLADRTGGRIVRAVDRQTHLTPQETIDILLEHGRLGGYLNLTFRALKSARNNRELETRLDAVEALPYFLDVVFALQGLVRPYNSYLAWALQAHPLTGWNTGELVAVIEQMLHGDADALRVGVARVHQSATAFDTTHGTSRLLEVLSEWYPDDYGDVLGLSSFR